MPALITPSTTTKRVVLLLLSLCHFPLVVCFVVRQQQGNVGLYHFDESSTPMLLKSSISSSSVEQHDPSLSVSVRQQSSRLVVDGGWHRGVLRRMTLFRARSSSHLTESVTLNNNNIQKGIIVQNMEHQVQQRQEKVSSDKMTASLTTSTSLPPLSIVVDDEGRNNKNDSKAKDVVLPKRSTSSIETTSLGVGGINSVTKNAFQNILTTRLDKWSKGENVGMNVLCHPSQENSVLRLARGQFQCDATVHLDRIIFGKTIRFSGGRIDIKKLRLNLWSFFGNHNNKVGGAATAAVRNTNSNNGRPKRYLNRFDFVGHNLTMTQEDLYESSCIRNGLANLLIRILTNRGMKPTAVIIESISILENGKLSIRGKAGILPSIASVLSPPEIPFEVRSNIGTASRGHVVTFHGMEISLSPSAGFFVPIFPELTIDLGNNAQLLFIDINAMTRQIQLCAKVTITPEHAMGYNNMNNYNNKIPSHFQQSAQSFAAMCSIDVGRWLTKVGRFAQ